MKCVDIYNVINMHLVIWLNLVSSTFTLIDYIQNVIDFTSMPIVRKSPRLFAMRWFLYRETRYQVKSEVDH